MWCLAPLMSASSASNFLPPVVNSSTLLAGRMGVPPVRAPIAASLPAEVPCSEASASVVNAPQVS